MSEILKENSEILKENHWKFYYWGPLLYHCRLKKDDLQKIKKLTSKRKPHNINLAGIIKDQFLFLKEDQQKFDEVIAPYLKVFGDCYINFFGYEPRSKPFEVCIKTMQVWTNFMNKGDANPVHVHTNCTWSSVMYLDVPTPLKKEQSKFVGTGCGPGGIAFLTGPAVPGFINYKSFRPHDGDFFIFPKDLYHYVAPFKSKCTRVSVAANFDVFIKEVK